MRVNQGNLLTKISFSLSLRIECLFYEVTQIKLLKGLGIALTLTNHESKGEWRLYLDFLDVVEEIALFFTM